MKKTGKKESGADGKELIKHSATGAVLGIIVTMMAIFLFSALLLTGTLPETMRDSLILVAVIIGATFSGLHCAAKQGRGVITAGVVAALAYVALVLMGAILFGKNSDEPSMVLRIVIAAVAGGCFGGVLKLNRKRKKSRLRK